MGKAFVIGIAGGSASGKSTLAEKLKEALPSLELCLMHMDSYFKPAEERAMIEAPVTGIPYRDDNHPSSFHLAELRQDLTEAIGNGQYQVILVEGLLTLWDKEILELLDLRLFVECRPDERIVRRLRRNMQWGLSFDEISDVYLDLVRYRHDEYVEPSKWQADLIINGSNPSERALELVTSYVKASL